MLLNLPLAGLGKCFFVRLGVAVAGEGECFPFTWTFVDDKTFLGNLEEDPTSGNQGEMTTARDARGC